MHKTIGTPRCTLRQAWVSVLAMIAGLQLSTLSTYIMVQLTIHVSVSVLTILYRQILLHLKGLKIKIVIFVFYKSCSFLKKQFFTFS